MTTNEQRAQRAWQATWRYHQECDDPDGDTTDETITDLLADLMHFCDEQGIEFDSCLRMANSHYNSEAGYYESKGESCHTQ